MNHAPTLTTSNRAGSILIIVAGISALLASLTLTFLVRMRTDTEESRTVMAYAQAKIMLAAACNYVQEASRLGYDYYDRTGSSTGDVRDYTHNEAFGWVDVRDGKTGPLGLKGLAVKVNWAFSNGSYWTDNANDLVDHGDGREYPRWPAIGGVARCPMFRHEVPPYAIALTAAPNAMKSEREPNLSIAKDATRSNYYVPLLTRPDPLPVLPNRHYDPMNQIPSGGTSGILYDEARYDEFAKGKMDPVVTTTGRAWFRVMRDGPSTFLVTCGSGGTLGFRDWAEVEAAGLPARQQFMDDRYLFATLRSSEIRLWYRIEWSAHVMEQVSSLIHLASGDGVPVYLQYPPNLSHGILAGDTAIKNKPAHRNPVGTIRWIQRLRQEPTHW